MDDYTLKSAARQAILRALRRTRGNKREAARLLECGKTTLYRKIDQYKIEKEDWECIPISELPKPPEMEVVMMESPLPENTESNPLMTELPEESQTLERPPSEMDFENGMSPTSGDFPITDIG